MVEPQDVLSPIEPEQIILGKHILVLLVALEPVEPSSSLVSQQLLFSGFLLEVNDTWFWVSSGHMVTDLQALLSCGYKIDRTRFFDLGLKWKQGFTTGFDLDKVSYLDDRTNGMDYAVFPLLNIVRENIVAGGSAPIPADCVVNHLSSSEHYFAAGAPLLGAATDLQLDATKFAIIVLKLKRLEDVEKDGFPRLRFDTRESQVKVGNESLKSLVGLSGSPIFAVNGDFREYGLIAIQSAQLEGGVFALACPARPLVDLLEAHLRGES